MRERVFLNTFNVVISLQSDPFIILSHLVGRFWVLNVLVFFKI